MTILALKGFSQSQLNSADQFSAWQERLAFVITMQRGSALASYSQESLKALDPREMLEKASVILVNGLPVAPDGTSQVGGISHGSVSAVTHELRRLDRRGNHW